MKNIILRCSLFCMGLGLFLQLLHSFDLFAEKVDGGPSSGVLVLNLKGTINPGAADFIKSGLKKAGKQNRALVILQLDTPGGLLSSTRDIVQYISQSEVPVAVWVSPGGASATSAGALIALSSHFVVMAPGTNLGAAHPVAGQGKDIPKDMKKKAVNDTVAFARSVAEMRGRDPQVAEEIVSKSLSLTADQALKKKIIDGIAPDMVSIFKIVSEKKVNVASGEKTVKKLSNETAIFNHEMSMGQKFLHVISNPNLAYMLLMLGGLGIYIEVTNPGLIFPGLLGAIALLLSFVSMQTLPINWGGIGLVFMGIVMLALEPFITSLGALTIGGILSIVMGALFLVDTSTADLQVNLGVIIGTTGALTLIAVWIGYYVTRALKRPKDQGGGFMDFVGIIDLVDEANADGTVGQVKIRGELWKFKSHESLNKGDKVVVDHKSGVNLMVKKAPKTEDDL